MNCYKCSTDNSERRRFCKKCGTLIVDFCSNCGFYNEKNSKYCGGCGADIIEAKKFETGSSSPKQEINPSGKYSTDEMNELISADSQKKSMKSKGKDIRGDDEVSQSVIDNIFEVDNENMDKKDK